MFFKCFHLLTKPALKCKLCKVLKNIMAFAYLLITVITIYNICAISPTTWKDDFRYNTYLNDNNTVRIFWTLINDTYINIGLQFPTTGWFAIGISPNGQMPNSDIAFAWIDNNGITNLQDRYTSSARTEPLIDENGKQNLQLIYGEEIDGYSYISFKRAIYSCDTVNDNDLADGTCICIYFYSIFS